MLRPPEDLWTIIHNSRCFCWHVPRLPLPDYVLLRGKLVGGRRVRFEYAAAPLPLVVARTDVPLGRGSLRFEHSNVSTRLPAHFLIGIHYFDRQ